MVNEMTDAYKAAMETHNEASKAFRAVQVAYRTGKVTDADFLAAKNVFAIATAAFDVAFAAEQEFAELIQITTIEQTKQIELF